MQKRKVRQYFVPCGDGTHKGAMQSFTVMTEIGHVCSVGCVPSRVLGRRTLAAKVRWSLAPRSNHGSLQAIVQASYHQVHRSDVHVSFSACHSFDSAHCAVLGRMAVHGAMAGYSGVTVGKAYERYVYLSIHAITLQKGRRVNPNGRWFSRMVATTKQPSCTPEGFPKCISDDPLRP